MARVKLSRVASDPAPSVEAPMASSSIKLRRRLIPHAIAAMVSSRRKDAGHGQPLKGFPYSPVVNW